MRTSQHNGASILLFCFALFLLLPVSLLGLQHQGQMSFCRHYDYAIRINGGANQLRCVISLNPSNTRLVDIN